MTGDDRHRRALRVWWVAALVGVTLVGLPVDPAYGHAFLVRTDPPEGTRLDGPPPTVSLEFSEPVEAAAARVSIRKGAEGETTSVVPRSGRAGRLLVVPFAGGSGIFVVSWRVAAGDGHESAGEFAFAVGPVGGSLPEATASGLPAAPVAVLASGLFFVGLSLAAGALALRITGSAPVFWVGAARAGLLAALAGGLLSWGRALAAGADAPDRQRLLLAAVVVLVAAALNATAWSRGPWPPALLAATAAGTWSARGQRAVADGALGAALDAAHLLAALVWAGALGLLVVELWRARRDAAVSGLFALARRYVRLAAVVVGVLVAAGLASAALALNRPGELWSTGYGRLLVAKGALLASALGLAVLARTRGLARSAVGALRRTLPVEAGLLGVVLILTAVLVNTAPPPPPASTPAVLGPPPLAGPVVREAGPAGQLTVAVSAGARQLRVEVFAPGGAPTGVQVDIDGRLPDGRGLTLDPRPCGPGCFAQRLTLPRGRTALTIDATADSWRGGRFQTTLDWPPPPPDPGMLARLVDTMRAEPAVALTERTSSGPEASGPTATLEVSGPEFVAAEPYAAGTADDIYPLTGDDPGFRLYISGDRIWITVWLDPQGRLARERIVNVGHLIERTFTYPAA